MSDDPPVGLWRLPRPARAALRAFLLNAHDAITGLPREEPELKQWQRVYAPLLRDTAELASELDASNLARP